jgi:hypothetical protein
MPSFKNDRASNSDLDRVGLNIIRGMSKHRRYSEANVSNYIKEKGKESNETTSTVMIVDIKNIVEPFTRRKNSDHIRSSSTPERNLISLNN